MGDLIDINLYAKIPQKTSHTTGKDTPLVKIKSARPDTFQRTKVEPPEKGLTLEEMIEIVGQEELDELFEKELKDTKAIAVTQEIDATTPLKEGLKKIWFSPKGTREENLKKADELAKVRKVFTRFERRCSARLEEMNGKKANIKIKFTRRNDSGKKETIYLTDALKKQEEFYRKGKLMASVYFIQQRNEHKRAEEEYRDYLLDSYYGDNYNHTLSDD